MFMQFPVFIVLYNTIRGMTRVTTKGVGKAAHVVSDPEFIDKHTRLYQNLIHSGGKMEAFGLNLADSVRSHQLLWFDVIPYLIVILVAVALQYVSIWQITNRNPQAGANQQMQQIQKFMPLIFVFIYIEFPAGVGLYFIISSMFRVGQQEWMYKRDPHILESMRKLKEMKAKNPTPVVPPPKGFRARLAALAPQVDPSLEPSEEAKRNTSKPIRKPNSGTRPSQNGRPASSRSGQANANGSSKTSQTGKPGQARRPGSQSASGQSKPGQPKSGQTRPVQSKPGQSKPGQGNKSVAGGKPGGSAQPGQASRPGQSGRNGQAPKTRDAAGTADSTGTQGNGSKGARPPASGSPTSTNGAPKSLSDPTQPSSDPPRRRGRPR
jgi:hypothetical protein